MVSQYRLSAPAADAPAANGTPDTRAANATSLQQHMRGHTRTTILELLRRHGSLTATALSHMLELSVVGVRQHLALLERDGLVQVEGLRHGVGRPSYVYSLAPAAESLFPKAYDDFAMAVLDDVAALFGEDAVRALVHRRGERTIAQYKPHLQGKSRAERITLLSEMLRTAGYMSEVQPQRDGSYLLIQHNCPLDCVARGHTELCKEEIRVYESVLEAQVESIELLSEGGSCCCLRISPA